MSKLPKEKIIDNLKVLSSKQDDVVATIAFGSISAKDIFSDVDIFLFTKTPGKYLTEDTEWLNDLGVTISKLNIVNRIENVMISRIMFNDCATMDVIPIDYSEFKKVKFYFMIKRLGLVNIIPKKIKNSIDFSLRKFYNYIRNEHFIIYDKGSIRRTVDNVLNHFDQQEHINRMYVASQENFQQNYNEFWQLAFKTIGMIVRGELFYGISVYENILKIRLAEMIEWHTFAFGKKAALSYSGKGIHLWASSKITDQLKNTFSFDTHLNSYNSVEATIGLYAEISKELISLHKYRINTELEKTVVKIVNEYNPKVACDKYSNG